MKSAAWGIILTGLAFGIFSACATVATNSGKEPGSTTVPVAQTKKITVQDLKITREEVRYADGVLASLTQSKFDAKGNLVQEEQFNGKKNLLLKKTVEMKADSRIAIMSIANPNAEVQGISVIEYDADGRVIKETLSNALKEIQSVSEYTYDSYGNRLTWVTRGQGQAILAKIVYSQKGMLTTGIEIQDASGQVVKRFTQEFNADKAITAKIEQDPSGKVLSRISFSYDKGKLAKEVHQNGDGILQRTVAYVYNDKDQPIRTEYYDRKGILLETRIQEFQVFSRIITVNE